MSLIPRFHCTYHGSRCLWWFQSGVWIPDGRWQHSQIVYKLIHPRYQVLPAGGSVCHLSENLQEMQPKLIPFHRQYVNGDKKYSCARASSVLPTLGQKSKYYKGDPLQGTYRGDPPEVKNTAGTRENGAYYKNKKKGGGGTKIGLKNRKKGDIKTERNQIDINERFFLICE